MTTCIVCGVDLGEDSDWLRCVTCEIRYAAIRAHWAYWARWWRIVVAYLAVALLVGVAVLVLLR